MSASTFNEEQLQKMKTAPGFVAALDQSGGSTPKALAAYGIKEGAWSNEEEMFALVHEMRARMAAQILATGLVPIVEPEVDIHCPDKAKAEELLKAALLEKLNGLSSEQLVFLKLTLPDKVDFLPNALAIQG